MSAASDANSKDSRFVAASRPPRARKSRTRPLTKRRRILRVVLWSLLVALLCALGIGGWALNRYVIDHVEIGDVKSYESSVNADTSLAPLATFSVDIDATELPQIPDTVAQPRSK